MAARWEVLHIRASTGSVLARLPVTALSYTDTLNQAGTAQVAMPLVCPEADPEVLYAGGSGLVVVRDGTPVWGGILWALDADLAAGTLTLSASGYHSHYKGRTFSMGESVTGLDIASCLKRWLAVGNGIGTDTSQLQPTGRKRTRSWTRSELKNRAEAVEDLADDIGGFVFRYVPYWADGRTRVGNRLVIADRPAPSSGLVLEHGLNCSVSRVSYDSSALATAAYALGADNGAGEKLAGLATNPALAARMPDKAIVETYQDVKETATLVRKAQAVINAGSAPVAIPQVTLHPGEFGPDQLAPGDVCSVRVDSGYVALLADFVVTERATTVDGNGRETVALALANKELFTSANPN